MLNSKIKITILITSYVIFAFCILMSFNAVVPERNLPVLELQTSILEKVENDFSRNKNSVYEILEKKNKVPSSDKSIDSYEEQKLIDDLEKMKDEINVIDKNANKKFKIQLASFKNEKKSLDVSKSLQKKISKISNEIDLVVKKVDISDKQTFFRILTKTNYSFENAMKKCDELKKNKIKCIVKKDNNE